MNAIEHGNDNRPDLAVDIEVFYSGTEIIVTITDHGGRGPGWAKGATRRSPISTASSAATRGRGAGGCSSSATWSTAWK